MSAWHNQRMMDLKRQYPYQITIKFYVSHVKAGRIPRPDNILPKNHASWVARRLKNDSHRTFGFHTHDALRMFEITYLTRVREWERENLAP